MAWLRSPLLYGALLLFIGTALGAVQSAPESGRAMTAADLRRVFEFQRTEQPIAKLDARYRPYAIAFILAGSDADIEAVKRTIDAELAAAAAVHDRGLAGVPEYIGEKLATVDLVLMALAAALLFRGLAFVLAMGFAIGGLHQLLVQSGAITGAPSEYYLAAILAALLWSAAFWGARALYEGRLKFGL
jgi:hypothetical protein